ncbi:3-dehydroquinate dehydratase [Sulfurimonas sp. SWIR-19]|uniref:3-dehydroquinate dehydratase n=1 Tax=Sulfurimonas sp. SWIR-19 TaxID=2878390 RepID=UPI001CF56B56|nr:3-dehydroquinate dehydratase [Sulfurimonas sp. SWIR-19]UCN00080.1 3-dehydroquinate dehydratase [Sulfurimonas sp. SWIR-19]
MKVLTRGLYALTLIILFQTHLFAEYLYKDEVIHNPKFTEEVETLGSALYKKTGISLRLIMLKELPKNMTMYEYEKQILEQFKTPTVLLTFSEMNSQVDIEANDKSLYKYFDKKQVLSPVTSYVQAFMMAAFYAKSWDDFVSIMSNTGGTILPLLGGKAKKGMIADKYSAAMFNGYLDIAQQIAKAKGVTLGHGFDSDANQTSLFYVRVLFYGFILYGIVMLFKRRIYKMRHKNEHYKKW